MATIRYAGYPSVVMYERPEPGHTPVPIQHLLWGDQAELRDDPADPTAAAAPAVPDGWTHVYSRRTDGWVRTSELQDDPVLEMTWVDVGQGDGTFILTPDGRALVVDAGAADNLYRYLRWRFDGFEPALRIDAAVITHSDADHYAGFASLFAEPKVEVERVVHNGLVERPGKERLGPAVAIHGRDPALVGLVPNDAELDGLLAAHPAGGSHYIDLLRDARARDWTTLATAKDAGYLPGFDAGSITIEVLSPIVDVLPDGRRSLPRFDSDDGRAKNGNSIVLALRLGALRVFLGGDLNVPAEQRLLGAVADPAAVYGADVAKACHHGSADFLEAFLAAVRPVATVISSGDDEGYSHPRPDSLGAIGANSRGVRPLIFSTELARSSEERIKSPAAERVRVGHMLDEARQPHPGETPEAAEARYQEAVRRIESLLDRSVAVYGAIQLRSDGNRVVMAQKIERPRNPGAKWDLYRLQRTAAPVLGGEDWVYCR